MNSCIYLMDQGEYQKAYEMIPLLRKKYKFSGINLFIALICKKALKFEDMIKHFDIVINIILNQSDKSNLSKCYFFLGIAYGKLHFASKSEEYFSKAYELEPEDKLIQTLYLKSMEIREQVVKSYSKFDNIF